MARLTAKDVAPELLELYDDHGHGARSWARRCCFTDANRVLIRSVVSRHR